MSAGELRLVDVVKHFHNGASRVRAVDGVTLTVEPGEIGVIYGPSGSGKSTLLLLAAGLSRPDRGTISVGGREISTLGRAGAAEHRRRTLGFVTQDAHLDKGASAVANASIKLLADGVGRRRARKAAGQWLDRVGLADRLNHLPHQLSAGQQARVGIARALVNEPRLILADEPTGSLDSRTGAQILGLLAEIAREHEAGLLIVTHDAQAAQIADVVLHLRDGKLTEHDQQFTGDREPQPLAPDPTMP